MEPSQPSRNPPKDKRVNSYLQYSGMAFEMLAIIGVFTAAGYFIDKWIGWAFPVSTIVFSLLGLGAAFYRILRSF